ncbi:MAG: rane protein TolA [Herbaspirillum sp.]|nr:rane protein TolA [Herbaspirillum sp.]
MAEVSNRPPKQTGAWRALLLALIVHIALFAFLWIGVRWQSETPLVVEAEIWDPQVREAAPLPEPLPPPPAPEVKPAPPPPPPKPVEAEMAKPDIALEQEKIREKKRKDAELQEQQRQQELAKQKQIAQDKKDKELKDQQQKEKDQKLAKQKADDAAKKKEEADKLADDKKRKQQEADKKASEKQRQDDLKRMMSQAGGTGDAAKSQGPRGNPAYASKVAAKIKSNTVFDVPEGLAGNPAAEYVVELLPDGSLRGLRLTKPSGVPGFDEAVKRAIEKSQPYPADTDGKVPSGFTVSHKPKDQ